MLHSHKLLFSLLIYLLKIFALFSFLFICHSIQNTLKSFSINRSSSTYSDLYTSTLFITNDEAISVLGSTFKDISSSSKGGCVYSILYTQNSQLRVTSSLFINCYSQSDAGSGAIYYIGAIQTIDSSCFFGCRGAGYQNIYIQSPYDGNCKIEESSFYSSTSEMNAYTIFLTNVFPQTNSLNFTSLSIPSGSIIGIDPSVRLDFGYTVFSGNTFSNVLSIDLTETTPTGSILAQLYKCFIGNSRNRSPQTIFSLSLPSDSHYCSISDFIISDQNVRLISYNVDDPTYGENRLVVYNCYFAFSQPNDPNSIIISYSKTNVFNADDDDLTTAISVFDDIACNNQGFSGTNQTSNETSIITPTNIAFVTLSLVLATFFTVFIIIDFCKKSYIRPKKKTNEIENENEEEEEDVSDEGM